MPFSYPIALEIEGRRCVVIGGGEIGEHKARALLVAGAKVVVVSQDFTEGLLHLAAAGEVELVRKPYSFGDLSGAFVAVAATDDSATNAEIFREAEEERVLLNAVDDVEHCHFAVPSIVRRGDLMIAISTGGKAPALAKRLRTIVAARFGPEYATLVDLLGEVRAEMLPRQVDFVTWAARWQRALDGDFIGLIREGRFEEAKIAIRRELAEHHRDGAPAGKVWIVGAGPGDPDLITVRGRQVLEEADVVLYDRLVHPSLVRAREAIYVGKSAGDHWVPQQEINEVLVRLAREGKRVVRLKGGDPFVFGRGAEEAEALAAAGIDFEIIPAPTSAVAALAYAGIPVTHRRFSSSVAFVTGHCAGEGNLDWKRLATSVETIVILMGLGRLNEIVDQLIEGGRDPDTPAAIVENGTLPSQRTITASLSDLPHAASVAGVESPAVIVVGDVVSVRDRIAWFQGEVRSLI